MKRRWKRWDRWILALFASRWSYAKEVEKEVRELTFRRWVAVKRGISTQGRREGSKSWREDCKVRLQMSREGAGRTLITSRSLFIRPSAVPPQKITLFSNSVSSDAPRSWIIPSKNKADRLLLTIWIKLQFYFIVVWRIASNMWIMS